LPVLVHGEVEILHACRRHDLPVEFLVDVAAGQLLEYRPGGVEIPVVVEEVGSRFL